MIAVSSYRWKSLIFDQDAIYLTGVLKEIKEILNDRRQLDKLVTYNLTTKGEKDRVRLAALHNFSGPDSATLELLRENGDTWQKFPWVFWTRPRAPDLASLDPQAQIVGCFLHTFQDDA